MAGCGKCRGVWVDKSALSGVARADGRAGRLGAARQARGSQVVKCPVCYYWMERTDFEKCEGLVVDVCRRHGAWLDAGELQRMLSFLNGGNSAPAASAKPAVLAASVIAVAPAIGEQKDRSNWDTVGEVMLDLADFIDLTQIGQLSDVGDLASGLGEVAAGLFSGL